ncbi:nicotinic acetylcholine receptor subunit beta, partial [Escherichia coli]|uniref:nicotinic acetylcholine receptor subunit beta n=1 Tax=Escherichia coli TaxID=562 RepID=UPI001FCE5C33
PVYLFLRKFSLQDSRGGSDCATERLTRARTGLVHVMNEIIPSVGGEQATVINSWLQKVTSLIDISLIDVESAK